MDLWQSAFLSEPSQERFRRAPVLRGFQPHPGERAAPRLDLGKLALDMGFKARFREGEKAGGPRLDSHRRADPVDREHTRNELREVFPDLP
jgi:hypothetical protein